jgi:tricorn protease-like protein
LLNACDVQLHFAQAGWLYYTPAAPNKDLWRVRVDGQRPQPLTTLRSTAYDPILSADGRWIAFSAGGGLYRVAANGGGEKLLYYSGPGASYPLAWSPNGRWLVVNVVGGDERGLLLIRSDGSQRRRLLHDVDRRLPPSERCCSGLPIWSTDGQWIVFTTTSTTLPAVGIYRLRPDGSELSRLATRTLGSWIPLSSDGMWVIYQEAAHFAQVHLTNGQIQPLPLPLESTPRFRWSADQNWLLGSLPSGSTAAIYQARRDGSELRLLTDPQRWSGQPLWVPPIDLPLASGLLLLIGAGMVAVGGRLRRYG